MVSEMATDKVILPEGFFLFGEDGAKITDVTVPVGKVVTARQELSAGDHSGNPGNTENGANEENAPVTAAPGNAGNESPADENNSGIIVIIIVVVVLLTGAFIFVLLSKKRKKNEAQ